ncbi:MAG: hypothetical protein LBS12_02625 [Prevotellaceae bacterium]|nr:hypothetical protein [Prevotellaceae bacterium]
MIALALDITNQSIVNAALWNLDANRVTSLTSVTNTANSAYLANVNDRTSNKETVEIKDAAFKELKRFLSLYIDYLEGNLSVPNANLVAMGLRSREHHYHEKQPVPDTIPVVKITTLHGQVSVSVAQGEDGHPTQSVNPEHYHGFKLRWRFLDEPEYQVVQTTRVRHTLLFNEADGGRHIALSVAWMNTTLEEGPWSEPVEVILN